MKKLPKSHRPFTDKYFLRANEILKKEGINPTVMYQVFVRKGPGIVDGLEEAVEIIDTYSPKFRQNGGKIYSLCDGDHFESCEPLMHIEGKVQDILELETMYLGVISAATTLANGGSMPDLKQVTANAKKISDLAGERPCSYFGARHWHWSLDKAINKAAFEGGFVSTSTDIGAELIGQKGMGTTPHALILSMGNTVDAIKAFDKHIDSSVPRIILIDTFNKEIGDALESAHALEGRLYGVRIDTCGENIPETCNAYRGNNGRDPSYKTGKGVTIEIARHMRNALRGTGHHYAKIVLSSGFGNPEKIKAFNEAEEKLGIRLYDALGVGGLYEARFATSDIVRIDGKNFAKKGRGYKANPKLQEVYT